jgi:hypothetical protein
VDPIELTINWRKVHRKLLDGLRCTAFNRYLGWFGKKKYLEMEVQKQQAEAEEEVQEKFRPRKGVSA